MLKEAITVCRCRVERCPEMDGFPHFDSLLQLCFLKLYANHVLELINMPKGIKPQNRDRALFGCAKSFDALHGGRLSSTVGSDQTEDLALPDCERDVIDRNVLAVGFSNS